MQYTISSNNLHVKSSFEIRKKDFERELLAIRAKHPDSLVWSRSITKNVCLFGRRTLCERIWPE